MIAKSRDFIKNLPFSNVAFGIVTPLFHQKLTLLHLHSLYHSGEKDDIREKHCYLIVYNGADVAATASYLMEASQTKYFLMEATTALYPWRMPFELEGYLTRARTEQI